MMTREEARENVEARIFNGIPFTFSMLANHCEDVDGMNDPWRIADGAIQRFRRKGLISFDRKGRETVWTLTEAGVAEKAKRDA